MENNKDSIVINNFMIYESIRRNKRKYYKGVCLNCGKEQEIRDDSLQKKTSIGCKACCDALRRKFSIGQVVETNDGVCTIVSTAPNGYCKIVFDGYTQEVTSCPTNVLKGLVRNPYKPAVYGRGYQGLGKYNTTDHKRAYRVWNQMLKRCFDRDERLSSYEGCTVDEKWLNFQEFAEDYTLMSSEYKGEYGQLDKDVFSPNILGKLYSPETCCILPHKLNTGLQMVTDFKKNESGTYIVQAMTVRGVVRLYGKSYEEVALNYSKAKAEYLEFLTEQHKDILPKSTYDALMLRIDKIEKGEFYA